MKTIKIFSVLLLLPVISFSQIQYGGVPVDAINIEEINFLTIDHSNIINNNLHPMVLKYANEYSVDINVPQLATKIEGSYESTFYLGIESPGDMALAFIFDEFSSQPVGRPTKLPSLNFMSSSILSFINVKSLLKCCSNS